jgi:hypothetical protein
MDERKRSSTLRLVGGFANDCTFLRRGVDELSAAVDRLIMAHTRTLRMVEDSSPVSPAAFLREPAGS